MVIPLTEKAALSGHTGRKGGTMGLSSIKRLVLIFFIESATVFLLYGALIARYYTERVSHNQAEKLFLSIAIGIAVSCLLDRFLRNHQQKWLQLSLRFTCSCFAFGAVLWVMVESLRVEWRLILIYSITHTIVHLVYSGVISYLLSINKDNLREKLGFEE